MKSIKNYSILLPLAIILFSCEPRYEDVAGEYEVSYNYNFSGSGVTGNAYASNYTITITQNEDVLSVDNTPGTIDRDGNITVTGSFLGSGTQTFNGSVNKSSGVITGDLSGHTDIDIWTGYYYTEISVTITSGTCTLTPVE